MVQGHVGPAGPSPAWFLPPQGSHTQLGGKKAPCASWAWVSLIWVCTSAFTSGFTLELLCGGSRRVPGRHLAKAGTPQAPVFMLGKPFQLKRRDGRAELWLPWAVFPRCGAFQVAGALLQGSIKPRRHPNCRKGASFFPFSCQIKHSPHTPFSCGVHEAEGSVDPSKKKGSPSRR